MISLPPLKISASDKLRVLRRLDRFRRWESLADQRQCIQCGEIITGREVEVVGGTRELGPLRLQCPTENCPAIPMDWIMPNGVTNSPKGPRTVKEPKVATNRRGERRNRFAGLLRSLRLVRSP